MGNILRATCRTTMLRWKLRLFVARIITFSRNKFSHCDTLLGLISLSPSSGGFEVRVQNSLPFPSKPCLFDFEIVDGFLAKKKKEKERE